MAESRPDSKPLEVLFAQAIQRNEDELETFLDRDCGDPELRLELEALLAADRTAQSFIDGALAAGARALTEAAPGSLGWAGPYRLVREIGRGGMGIVYLAERCDDEYERQVAIKLLEPLGMDEGLKRRFLSERQILAQLDHPNIARLFDGGTSADGRPYLVMEYIDGEPIHTFCDRHSASIEQRLDLFEQICRAVLDAHQKLIIHRDLKPSNVLVTREGVPKLLDFGVAKWLKPQGTDPTVRGQGMMTPNYASPEQLNGEPITTGSDVYSLGIMLYFLLTGERPYHLEMSNPVEFAATIERGVQEKPSERIAHQESAQRRGNAERRGYSNWPRWRRRLRGDLDTLVLKALRPDPERRYRSVEQLLEDLARYRQGHPILARPDTLIYRLGKFIRRHRWGVFASTAFAALLVVFVLATVSQANQTARERDRAARVSKLLIDLFEIADPQSARGQAITARELLDHGAEQLAELPDDLETAPMLDTLAGLYEKLELHREAVPLYERALTIREAQLESSAPEVGTNLHVLARAVAQSGQYERAEALSRQAFENRRRNLGARHPDVASSLNNLALVLHDLGRYLEAEELYLDVLSMDRELMGPEHPIVTWSLSNLALLRLDMGEIATAESLYREALEIRQQAFGDGDPDVAVTLEDLALALQMRGDFDQAEPLLRRALQIKRSAFGDEHRSVARTMHSLGRLMLDRGDVNTAAELLNSAYRLRLRLLEDPHPDLSASLAALAELAQRQGDLDLAQDRYLRSLAGYRNSLTPEHPLGAGVLIALGDLLVARGACAEALPWLEQAQAIRQRTLPSGSWMIAEAESVLGGALLACGESGRAGPRLENSTRQLIHQLGKDHPRTRLARARLERLPQTE